QSTDYDRGVRLPQEITLRQNYPNPFNPTTTIAFSLPVRANVVVDIFNIAGRRVKTILQCDLPAGDHAVSWDGTSANGAPVASGVYLYRLQAGELTVSKKMLLLK
ncbi:T9SS type A sorting domain-containing protein, partial [candidate division GN15 bacterium]|nr:T9SS type A sorting domain-containing protein [candidate division GN15 bacterium]